MSGWLWPATTTRRSAALGPGGVDASEPGTAMRDGGAFDVPQSDVAPDRAVSAVQNDCFGSDEAVPWTTITPLDTLGCEMRPVVVCGASGTSTPERLGAHLLGVARGCGLREYTYVQVAFVAGCPSGVRLRDAVGRPVPAGLLPCLVEALESQRWDCAIDLPCATVEYDTLP
jgi:hypothetical protein